MYGSQKILQRLGDLHFMHDASTYDAARRETGGTLAVFGTVDVTNTEQMQSLGNAIRAVDGEVTYI